MKLRDYEQKSGVLLTGKNERSKNFIKYLHDSNVNIDSIEVEIRQERCGDVNGKLKYITITVLKIYYRDVFNKLKEKWISVEIEKTKINEVVNEMEKLINQLNNSK